MRYITFIFFRLSNAPQTRDRILGTEVTLTYHGNTVASCGTITESSTDNTYILTCPVTMATGVNMTDDEVEQSADKKNYNNGIAMNIAELWVYGEYFVKPAIGNYRC